MKNIVIASICILSSLSFSILSAQISTSEVIQEYSHYEVKGNRLQERTSITIQINDRAGDEDAHIILFYSKGDKLKIKTAQIEDKNGNIIRKIKASEIIDQSAVRNSTLYSDDFIKRFELVHNTYPYRIKYEYEYETSRFLNIVSLNYAGTKMPIREHTIIVDVPLNGYQMKVKQENVDDPTIEVLDKEQKKRYIWKTHYETEGETNINTNFNTVKAPRLEVLPINFKYGEEGNSENWKSFGNWIYKLNEGRDALPDFEKSKIDKLIEGIKDTRNKINILYNYMQDNARYINVKLKVGGFQTYPADYVCTNKYGDCKALTNYMQSMLKYIGIKSYYTLIYSDDFIEDIDPNFAAQEFNHVILTVPTDSDTLYLECTSKNLAFGYIHSSIQGRQALLIENNNSHLINIPATKTEEIECNRLINVNLTQSNFNNVTVRNRLKGYPYEFYNSIKDGINKNAVDIFIRNNIMSGSYTLEDYTIINPDRNQPYVDLNLSLAMNNLHKSYGQNLSITPFSWSLPHYETPQNRVYDLQINYPTNRTDTIIYRLPEGILEKLPENIRIETPFGVYTQNFEMKDKSLIIYKSLKINSGRYSLEEYPLFYMFITQVRNNELKNIYLEKL